MFGGLYFLSTNYFMGNFFNAILVFQAERPVFLREQANKMYSVFPYYITKISVDMPVLMLTTLIGTLITYFIINLQVTAEQFFLHYLAVFLLANAAQSFGYILSSIFESETAAAAMGPIFVMPMLLFGGLFANNNICPVWLRWVQYVSPMKYASEAILTVEFLHDPRNLRDNLLEFLDYRMGYWACIGIFVGLIVLFRTIAFFFFKLLIRKF